ncbi:MAG: ATP-binding protein [Acidobacteria bacterium]|nr:ATP-binding protein [Acidobacteriota bacterium]
MSKVNIKRTVENIRANTTVYSPIIEVVVNALQSIQSSGRRDGNIAIRIHRDGQTEMDGGLPGIRSFEVEDNGLGFTEANRESFDTLYSDLKSLEGGKGFGRFICLKYFADVSIDSVFAEGEGLRRRTFSMGKDSDIIIHEKVALVPATTAVKTIVHLRDVKDKKFPDKKLETVARNLAERLLPHFITKDYVCPSIVLSAETGDSICLNEWFSNEISGVIKEIEIPDGKFVLKAFDVDEHFEVRVFKLYSPKNQKSKISLVAHRREVSGSPIDDYVPEFGEDFYDRGGSGESVSERNYIVKAYVFGPYLDRHVSLERGGFEFERERDLHYGIGQAEIEEKSASIAKEAVGTEVAGRQEKKRERVHTYVEDEAPWHRVLLEKIDLSGMPLKPSNEEIESRLQKEKFKQEAQIKRDVSKILSSGDLEGLEQNVKDIVEKISGASRNDLIHYIAMRRNILDLFGKSLQWDENHKYSSEGFVHDIIFPRKGDIFKTPFHDHNLWIIDERLNFTTYLSSDVPLDGGKTERPDLIAYDRRVVFRGDNESSNPVTIFEFKKPQRDDFVNKSSDEDPVEQIVRYVNSIVDGKFKTPEGLKILVAPNTPFYGFVVCDLTAKVERWLFSEKDFKPMPDKQGWFSWKGNINLYIEVLSWDKVLKDAQMRNKVFFHKLGI